MFRSAGLVLALGTLLLAGCTRKESSGAATGTTPSSSTTSTAQETQTTAAENKGACSYIAEAEASEILGQPSKYRSTEGGSSNCIIDPASGQGISVDFTVERNSRGIFDYLSKQKGAETVSGLGDQAVWSGNQLALVKSGNAVYLTIGSVSGGKSDDLKSKAVAFAQRVLAKL